MYGVDHVTEEDGDDDRKEGSVFWTKQFAVERRRSFMLPLLT